MKVLSPGFFAVIALLLTCDRNVSSSMQTPPVSGASIPENIRIDSAGGISAYGPCEPSIAINPLDLRQVVAGAILDRVYVSRDSGRTWSKSRLTSPYGVFGDPVVLADFSGNFFYAHLSDPTGKQWGDPTILDRIVIQKSSDGGNSWSEGAYTGLDHPRDQDKQWLATDPETHHVYISWTEFDQYASASPKDKSRILFSKSTNQGGSWSAPVQINQLEGDCLDDDKTTEGAVPAVGPNGEIYVAWAFDGKIFLDRSLDGGASWLEEDILVAEQPGGWTFGVPGISRCNGLPVTATDPSSGPYRGTVYVNWSDQRFGPEDTDVWVARSADRGKTWSSPVRVNDDPPGKHQFFTWMAVDPVTGFLYVVFYDRRHYGDTQTDVFLAVSKDGGKTFQNRKISASPFQPVSSVFFGDYNHISVYNGVVRPIWTRADGTRLSVWTALIRE